MRKIAFIGFCIMVCSIPALAPPPPPPVPEIDAGTMSTAVALLAGSILLLRARFRSK